MGKKREYEVTIPMAGHFIVTVEAESEEVACELAFEQATLDHLENWEMLTKFSQGNVCYCPQPWKLTVKDNGEVDD